MISTLLFRLATHNSLRNQTVAGANIFDSTANPDIISDIPLPIVQIRIDNVEMENDDVLLFEGNPRVKLTLEAAIVTTNEQDGVTVITNIETTTTHEQQLDILTRQIISALTANKTEWASYWSRAARKVHSFNITRNTNDDETGRFAKRSIIWDIELIAEPHIGASLQGVYGDIVQLLENTPDQAALASTIRSLCEATPSEGWNPALDSTGIQDETALTLGLKALNGLEENHALSTLEISSGYAVQEIKSSE